jgi:hypothetical protein
MEKENNQLSLELKPEVAKGSYSNLAIITHSHSEFIIDFADILPGMPKPDITNRIIMTPEHAKRLMSALIDNISKYESSFGPIDMGERQGQQKENTFNLGDFTPFNNGTKS